MHIKALQTASAIEFPNHIADVVYVGGCNFRCPFCYNVDLVLYPHKLPDLDASQVLAALSSHRRLIDGVVLTGGEPTLQPDLESFVTRVRDLDLDVKLDTNGSHPEVISRLVLNQLVDYVAMDVKTALPTYDQLAGVPVDTQTIKRTIHTILTSGVDHEFRTTVVPDMVGEEQVLSISQAIKGARRYFLQGFRPVRTVSWGECPPVGAPTQEALSRLTEVAAPYVDYVGVRSGGQSFPV